MRRLRDCVGRDVRALGHAGHGAGTIRRRTATLNYSGASPKISGSRSLKHSNSALALSSSSPSSRMIWKSRAGDPGRARQAPASLDRRLVRRDLGLIQIFDPPFDTSELKPGYVKGYAPGVRENGGQYTHAAVWAVMAFAEAGEVERAWELFRLIDPVRHGDDAAAIATYQVEPYVMAADVYTNPQHACLRRGVPRRGRQAGRGGWTWYTGSAGG